MSEVGDSIKASAANWKFSGDVPSSFEGHVSKSVPFYEEGHDLILKLSDFFLQNSSVCYDLGCSTGLLTHKLAIHNAEKRPRIIAIDTEHDMITFAKQQWTGDKNVIFLTDDAISFEFEKADLIIAYYTVQFVRPSVRQLLMDRIYQALNWGGAFILFEKVRGADARFQDITSMLYTEFKLDSGYSAENIVSKARSLKGVLEPFSTQGNLDLLKRAGFADIMTVMKYVCFEGFLAIK